MTALRLVQVLAPDFRNLLRISLFGGLPQMEQPSSRLRARSMRYAHRVKSHLSVLSRPDLVRGGAIRLSRNEPIDRPALLLGT